MNNNFRWIEKKRMIRKWSMGLIVFFTFGLSACDTKKPIKIGFVGGLTGHLSLLGIGGRDGVLLAVEQINQSGGINGRPVQLIIKDDKNDAETAIMVDQELIEEKVVAIIGHMTSAMSLSAVPLINKEKMLMISPTSTTNLLTAKDDYFLRTALPDRHQTDQLVHYATKKMGIKKIAGVYDLSNQAFTEGWYLNFKSEFENQGGVISKTETYNSKKETSYLAIAKKIIESNPDGVVIVASALDTALLCQQLRKIGFELPVFSSGWAKAPDLLQNGGGSVENLILPQTHSEESTAEKYLQFKKEYEKRFGREPDFAAAGAYDAIKILFTALSQTKDSAQLKSIILKQSVFHGLQSDITIDQFGDAQRKTFLIQVKDDHFRTIE